MKSSVWSLPVGSWKWWHAIVAYVVVMLMISIPTFLMNWLLPLDGGSMASDSLMTYGVWMEVLKFSLFIFAPILVMSVLTRQHASRADFGLFCGHGKKAIIATIVGLAIFIGATLIFEHYVSGAQEASEQVGQSFGFGKAVSHDLLLIFVVTVMAPLGEEFLFRGFLFRAVRDGLANFSPFLARYIGIPLLVATVFSANEFMNLHGGEGQDLQLYMFGLMGIITALAYAWSGSLVATIMIHSLNNAYAVFLLKDQLVNHWLPVVFVICGPLIAFALSYIISRVLGVRRRRYFD